MLKVLTPFMTCAPELRSFRCSAIALRYLYFPTIASNAVGRQLILGYRSAVIPHCPMMPGSQVSRHAVNERSRLWQHPEVLFPMRQTL